MKNLEEICRRLDELSFDLKIVSAQAFVPDKKIIDGVSDELNNLSYKIWHENKPEEDNVNG